MLSSNPIAPGSCDLEMVEQILGADLIDAVAFGRPFITNPDLSEWLANGWLLADLEGATLVGGEAEGSTTIPAYQP